MKTDSHETQPWPGARNGAALTSDLTVGDSVDIAARVAQARQGVQPGWRSNLWVSATISELETGLRLGARTWAPVRAAVELIIETGWLYGARGWHLGAMVQAREPGWRQRSIDWHRVVDHLEALPGTRSEKAVLRIAASLAGGGTADLGAELAVLDRRHRGAVRRALKRATRRHGRRSSDFIARVSAPPPPITYR